MEENPVFHFEVEKLPDDQAGNKVTTVKCHGRVKAENVGALKGTVKSLIAQGGRIVIDLSDVHFVDSSGLGAFVALKVTAVKQGMCILEFVNMTSPHSGTDAADTARPVFVVVRIQFLVSCPTLLFTMSGPAGTPSPVPLRLMKAPSRATLSPKGERGIVKA